ncbi:MAG TPA: glycosyltransferase family 2 protein [Thermoplasmata archaeon]|nr:glycosyltransferase family 2 protein [Thermoplasmata archaeon]
MRASFVVPTLNEERSVGEVLRSFHAAADAANRTFLSDRPLAWETLVVDGASTDRTAAIAEAEGARVLTERRRGYGRAYKTGFRAAQGEVIATSDGDGTYPVETIPGAVRRLLDERIDFLSGDRMSGITRRSMTTEHRIGNGVLNLFLGIAYHRYLAAVPGRRLVDSQSGYWVFRRDVLEKVHLTSDGMAFSEELKLEAIVRGLRFVEVPIAYGERATPPKLQSGRDGIRNLVFLATKRLALAREVHHGSPVPFARGEGPSVPP